MRFLIAPVIAVLFLSIPFSVASGQISSLVSDWTGESICIGDNPSCHDEKVVYHISTSANDSTKVSIAADKIVDGKPEPMGTIDLKYDASRQTLSGEAQTARYQLLWEFAIKGNTMEGALSILPNKTVARRIKVHKQDSTQKERAMTNHATGAFEVKLTPQDDKSDDKTLSRMTF